MAQTVPVPISGGEPNLNMIDPDFDYTLFRQFANPTGKPVYNFFGVTPKLRLISIQPFLKEATIENSSDDIAREIKRLQEQARLYAELYQRTPASRRRLRQLFRVINTYITELEQELEKRRKERNVLQVTRRDGEEEFPIAPVLSVVKDFIADKPSQGNGLKGGMILKQKLKGFEISNDGYGVEVDKLFTKISKQTLVDVMKQLGETQNQYALMKKSKSFLMHYFMKTYASDKHSGSKVVADNRPKKKEKFESVQDKRFAEYQSERRKKGLEKRMQEAVPVKLSRPAPVRRGKKDISL